MHGTGIALGLFEHSEYSSAETVLNPGDLLVFYSDGITEAEDPRNSHSRKAAWSSSSSVMPTRPRPQSAPKSWPRFKRTRGGLVLPMT